MAQPSTVPVRADAVSSLIRDLRARAEASAAKVEAYADNNTQALAGVVVAYRALLADTGGRLIRLQMNVVRALTAKPGDPALTALLKRTIELLTLWTAHAKGYSAYERPATDAEKGRAVTVGVAPVVIIAVAAAAAVIAVSIVGVAWAVVHYEEAKNLSDEVAVVERDPSLADALAKLNTTAPSTPIPTPPGPGSDGWGWLLAAFGVAAAAFFIVPKLGKG